MLFAVVALASSATVSAQEAPKTRQFLELSEGERFWFLEGAFRTVSHLVSLQDKTKGECASRWYLQDRAAKQKLITETMAKYPKSGETTIILSLLQQACGKFTP